MLANIHNSCECPSISLYVRSLYSAMADHVTPSPESLSRLEGLPLELLQHIIRDAVLARGVARGTRLRLINRK